MPLPINFRASSAFWLLASLIWLLLIAALIHAGFKPDYWQLRHIESGTLPYPTDSVVTFALIILVEIVVLGLIVQPWRFHRLWLRMLVCAFPWLGWTVLWGVTAMHQSPVRDVHLNWVLAVAAILLVALLVVVPASTCPRLRRWLNG
ncbi:hypothetical protein E5C33_07210 [Stenotrophomonas maltophilia]|uniref:hypothetical protein n=1 Tax=Stenotrophomonas maltophilia TaxID=40324 RepID=UPI001075FF7A|nr:hypothetical protein [Stenotrophomonas maltophilia]TFZ46062.1 hypothetical protein E5C33_07210 [Stenotrophomonas maltophilia]